MKALIFVFWISLSVQFFEDSKSEIVMESIDHVILFFSLSLALLVMVLIPVILFFSMVDNFFLIKKFYKKIDLITCFQKDNSESEYFNSLCGTYLKVYKNFFKNMSGLAAWNVFSLFYILYYYDSFETGLKEYFYFPFKVFQTIMNQETFNRIYVFKTEGLSMVFIVILTTFFFYAGKYIGIYIANKALSKKKLSFRPNTI